MTNLSDIIEKLEKAEAGSRELDYQVFRVFAESEGFNFWNPDWGHEYTCSVDAAISLAEKVLPGWQYTLSSTRSAHEDRRPWADVASDAWINDENETEWGDASAATLPMALCLAILKAKAQQQEGGE